MQTLWWQLSSWQTSGAPIGVKWPPQKTSSATSVSRDKKIHQCKVGKGIECLDAKTEIFCSLRSDFTGYTGIQIFRYDSRWKVELNQIFSGPRTVRACRFVRENEIGGSIRSVDHGGWLGPSGPLVRWALTQTIFWFKWNQNKNSTVYETRDGENQRPIFK